MATEVLLNRSLVYQIALQILVSPKGLSLFRRWICHYFSSGLPGIGNTFFRIFRLHLFCDGRELGESLTFVPSSGVPTSILFLGQGCHFLHRKAPQDQDCSVCPAIFSAQREVYSVCIVHQASARPVSPPTSMPARIAPITALTDLPCNF